MSDFFITKIIKITYTPSIGLNSRQNFVQKLMVEIQKNNFFNLCKKIVAVLFCCYILVHYWTPIEIPEVKVIKLDILTDDDNFYYTNYEKGTDTIKEIENERPTSFEYSVASKIENYQDVDDGGNKCPMEINLKPVDIQMLNLYEKLPLNSTDYANECYLREKYKKYILNDVNKLKVFLVPHSHNDPGWTETFDTYYTLFTRSILMNAINYLTANPDMKFIWAEISFFSRFYETLKDHMKYKLKKLVINGQLEFVTGGWVMPDEASTHWYSIIIQLTEGQRWLHDHLNVTPISSWSIDPFGHSSTMPYLLKKCGFQNLLIQRTHHLVKNYLARNSLLEFRWQQLWDKLGDTEMFTHMMPFSSYSVSRTCGPDPNICEKFDFPQNLKTNNGESLIEIDTSNIAYYSDIIINEWRKKSALFKTKSVLVPIGDDFRYSSISEWTAKHKNFQILFEYINNKPELFTQAKFATLQEYFDSVRNEKDMNSFPTLNGDFFPYSDGENDYWTGYFTSRPYFKCLERILLHYVRSAEILRSLNNWGSVSKLDEKLEYARQQLSLFQHHDAITGTSADHVVADYEIRILRAIEHCKYVMQQTVHRLLTKPNLYKLNYNRNYFYIDDSNWPGRTNRYQIIENKPIAETHVVFQNSLPQWREEFVDVYVTDPNVKVTDSKFKHILAQLSFLWSWKKVKYNGATTPQAKSNEFKLTFKIKIPPFGLRTYILHTILASNKNPFTSFTNTTILTDKPGYISQKMYTNMIHFGKPQSFTLTADNGSKIAFTSNGLLHNIALNGTRKKIQINLDFIKYGESGNPSGAYIFSPGENKSKIKLRSPTVIISRGELESTVSMAFPFGIHSTTLRNNGEIEIQNLVDISNMDQTEIAMQLSTQLNNKGVFYTDSNAFQILKRKYSSDIPLQGNYYPISSSIYIEGENTRVTILSSQPLGGTSSDEGNIEIMQDRLLLSNDGKGLLQGITDNKPVLLRFRLLIESCYTGFQGKANYPGGFLTLKAYTERQKMLSPINKFIWKKIDPRSTINSFGDLHKPLQNDMEIAMMRNLGCKDSLNCDEVGVIVHRSKLHMCGDCSNNNEGLVNFKKLLNLKKSPKIYSTYLTFIKYIEEIVSSQVKISPMDIKAFIIRKS